jgi:hypothetical protein
MAQSVRMNGDIAMTDLDTAGMDSGRREDVQGLCARIERLEKRNRRLVVGMVGAGLLGAGALLGGMNAAAKDKVIAYTATDETMYRVYDSGRIEYLRLDEDPPRTAHGVFDWGVVKIDENYTLRDRP